LEEASLILLPHPWHHLTVEKVSQILGSDSDCGLTSEEVVNRQTEYGLNRLTNQSKESIWQRFIKQFQQPVQYILLVAATVTALFKEPVDAGVIFAVAVGNAVIGFIQEAKAENAIAALAEVVTVSATVLRDDQKLQISSRELTIGDLVVLAAGDKVPADLRLTDTFDLQIDESGLTGESVPIMKIIEPIDSEILLADRLNMVYAGSLVTAGQGMGFVVAIADQTETGRVAQLMQHSTNLKTPLTRKIDKLSRTLLYAVLGLAAMTLAIGLGRGGDFFETFKAAVALAVSAVPEGLPAIVTIMLASGVSRMAKRNAIVRELPAVETLGSTTVICSDKTGTLTKNQMTVQEIVAGGLSYGVTGVGYAPEGQILSNQQLVDLATNQALRECLQAGLLCNDAHLQLDDDQWEVVGDPTEGALLVAAGKAGLDRDRLETELPRLDVLPFSSKTQYMATLHEHEGTRVVYIKGSIEAILPRCLNLLQPQSEQIPLDLNQAQQQAEAMSKQGLRVLAFAKKVIANHAETIEVETIEPEDLEQDLIFLGLQGMIDPPRPEEIAAVRDCHNAGIQVKMITGDHPTTAKAIAQLIGLQKVQTALTGYELSQMPPDDLRYAVESTDVFARVAPEQKLRLVEALQAKGEIVAMTGDGVNDAPALKQADIGVAMGMGTEVAKEAAQMVLTDNNFASIRTAVEEGRTVYRNLRRAIGFILPISGGESLTILLGILLGTVLPIVPVQILWINLVSAIALSLPLAFEPKSQSAMQRPPRDPNEALLSRGLLLRILIISVWNCIVTFGMFDWGLRSTNDPDIARTIAINALVSSEIFYLLSISSLVPNLVAKLRGKRRQLSYAPAIGAIGLGILQVLFSQWAVMNELFETQPLTFTQGALSLVAGLPIILWASLVQKIDPID
jgi:cation-transporting P-type ATPase F